MATAETSGGGLAGRRHGRGTKLKPQTFRSLLFWISVLVIVGVSAGTFFSVRNLLETGRSLATTQQILHQLEFFLSSLKDAETGQRGYLITGEDEYLVPYEAARETVPPTLARLGQMFASDNVQAARLQRLESLARERFQILQRGVDARRAALSTIFDAGRLATGNRVMNQVRLLTGEMMAQEQTRYANRLMRAERLVVATAAIGGGAVIVSLGMILLIFRLVNREVARRRTAEADLQALNLDLEEQVRARTAELRREGEERRRQAELMETVFDEAPVAIVALDPDRRVILWNAGAEQIFGYVPDEVLDRPYPLVPAGTEAEFDAIFTTVLSGERLRNVAVRRQRKDGTLLDVVFSGAPLRDEEGRLRAAVFVLEDVTARNLVEQQLRHANRLEAIGQLTGGIAHDFNNLLGVIVGNLDLLEEQVASDPEAVEHSRAALEAALHGADLVKSLLAFARKQPLSPALVDLNERVPAFASMMKRALGEQYRVVVAPAPTLWKARVDPVQVENAVLNLAINARDAMPAGGVVTVETGNAVLDEDYAAENAEVVPGEYVMIAVSDSGSGMPPEVVQRAFEPFFTTKEAGSGTGLGLSMVYGFVKQSGGHVKIYSELGHGTTVKLYLPRADTGEGSGETPVAAGPAATARGERVLVVEDNPGVRKMAVQQLRQLGYTVDEAEDGIEGLEYIESAAPFDLLFTDIILPGGVTGYQLADRARESRPGLRVLFTSGYTERSQQPSETQLGAHAPLLSKPYRRSELAAAVRAALQADPKSE